MKVKGSALKTTRDFVKTKFKEDYSAWYESLPASSKEIYNRIINATEWYQIEPAYLVPISKISKMFYGGDNKKCGYELGYYSAEVALKGFYKVFILIASPANLVQRASKIITTYYQPSEVEAFTVDSKSIGLKILKFDKLDEALEYRVVGWCIRALELSNCSGVNYNISKSLTKKDNYSEIIFTWK
jgi:hypothetical protein